MEDDHGNKIATEHHFQENYSGRNPVPTVQGYEADIKLQREASQAAMSDTPPRLSPQPTARALNSTENETARSHDQEKELQTEKEEMMNRMSPKKEKPVQELQLRGERTVKDPVTGADVVIRDSGFDLDGPACDNHALHTAKIPQGGDGRKHISPIPVSPGNICLQPFPPPVPADALSNINGLTNNICYVFTASLAVIWLSTAFKSGLWSLLWKTGIILTAAGVSVSQVGLLSRRIEKELERVRFEMHRQRGIKHSPPTPESTEWLNAFITTFMGLINPEMFLPLADTIEDVMQASLPSFIDAVKVSDVGQGDTPFRILSMRALPDRPGDPEYPRHQWITGDFDQDQLELEKSKDEQSGDYVNYEVAYAYQAQPGQSDELRSHNIHLLIEFFVGVFDWLHIPIPIWIQIEGLAGTVRLRLQMIPESPYIRNLTFTMMGVPKISVSAKPMLRAIPNVLDLPVVSGFVQSSIAAACAEYVAPRSMTINIQELLSGSGVKEVTHAIGVIMIIIHHAENLSAQDANGTSDPYIVLAYAKFGKPLYSTRIITEELNPVFEETAFLLVSEDEVKAKEELSVMLWDSDERSADDLVGRIQLPISKIMSAPNQMHRRKDPLRGFEDAEDMPGHLTWSVGYFTKATLEASLQRDLMRSAIPEAGAKGEPQGPKTPSKSLEVRTTNTPPNKKCKSGVLSIIIHHINNLERANLKGASGSREGAQGQDTAAPSEQDNNLPSGYCEIIVNDLMIYKTRVKQYTTMPFFEAGTEHFIRDWTETVVRVAVRDSRIREKDPLLGVITIDLEDLFTGSKSSQVTQIFSLQEGVGFGRAQISVLFEAVRIELPKNLLGWDTATLEITTSVTAHLSDEMASYLTKKQKKLKVKTSEDTYKLNLVAEGSGLGSQAPTGLVTWTNAAQVQDYDSTVIRLPIYERFKANIVFDLGSGQSTLSSLLPGDSVRGSQIAILWLNTLEDDVEKEIRLPIITGPKLKALRQNFINDQTKATHDYEICGFLTFKARVDPGLDPDHAKYAQSAVARHTFEAYDNTEGQAEQAVRNAHAMHRKQESRSSSSTQSSDQSRNLGGFTHLLSKKDDEQKAIDKAHSKALASRHRGAMQYGPVRTSVWMKEGITRRARDLKNRITGKVDSEPHVETEGRG